METASVTGTTGSASNGEGRMTPDDYKTLMDKLLALPACALFTTGRTGTDLLQSLLDSHPEVLTFNGHILFHSFWQNSTCVAAGEFASEDLIEEFIGKHIEFFKSRYDTLERKHQLGDKLDKWISIDLERFRTECHNLLHDREVNSRTVLLAIYGAYALCLGQDLTRKKLLFHHPHDFGELPRYLQDFRESKIICMTRDPRANFVSGIEHHRDHNPVADFDNGGHVFFYINRILNDAAPVEGYSNDYRVVRIEDLGRQEILETLCGWLDIGYDQCLTESTWAGLRWHSDRLSKVNHEPGFSQTMLENQWENRLSLIDKFVLNYIMNPRLKSYNYTHSKVGILEALTVPFLILLPLSYELRFWSPGYLRKAIRRGQIKGMARNGSNYLRRVRVFLKFYLRVVQGKRFEQPLLWAEPGTTAAPSLKEI